MTNKDKLKWLHRFGTFMFAPGEDENMGTCWLEGSWISRHCKYHSYGCGPTGEMEHEGVLILAGDMYDEFKEALYKVVE